MKDIEVKFQEHFKLEVPFKNMIVFESELQRSGIKYYCEENEPFISDGIRYFLLDNDREKIDSILIKNGIIAGTETINVVDYRDNQKIQKAYLIVSLIVIGLILIVSFFIVKKAYSR